MAKTKIGKIPVYKGEYDNNTIYDRLNQVTYLGTTFQSIVDDNLGHPPAEKSEDGGEILYINTNYWDIIAKGLDNVEERTATDNSMGYKILKKNKSFAEQVIEENTIYEIRYNFTLTGDVTIPANCILKFDGGSISGTYKLSFLNTLLEKNIKLLCDFDGTVKNKVIHSSWFNIINDGIYDNYTVVQKVLNIAENKTVIFDNTNNQYFLFTDELLVYKGTTIDGSNLKFRFNFSSIMDSATIRFRGGFRLSDNCSIENIDGFCYANAKGHNYDSISGLITCGLFYGISNTTRELAYNNIPNIESVTIWDAPTNVTIKNIKSNISLEDTSKVYQECTIFLTNFVKNYIIDSISCIGFAQYLNSSSLVSTGTGIFNMYNPSNVVRFEWGNYLNENEDYDRAAGSNILISNIYGKGLTLHDHSAVVSMGNAYNFKVCNVVGEKTGQVIYCGVSQPQYAKTIKSLATSNRIIDNIIGKDLYIYPYDTAVCGAIAVEGNDNYSNTLSNCLNTSTIINNINITGGNLAEVGIRLGQHNYDESNLSNVIISNAIINNFTRGIRMQVCKNIIIQSSKIMNSKYNAIFIEKISGYSFCKNIIIENCEFINNCIDYREGSYDSTLFAKAKNLTIRNCYFGNETVTITDKEIIKINNIDGTTILSENIKVDNCVFYASAESYDISFDSSSPTSNQIRVTNCLSNKSRLRLGYSWVTAYIDNYARGSVILPYQIVVELPITTLKGLFKYIGSDGNFNIVSISEGSTRTITNIKTVESRYSYNTQDDVNKINIYVSNNSVFMKNNFANTNIKVDYIYESFIV